MTVYKVASLLIGDKIQGDKIVFNSLKDMKQAYEDVDNDLDIYVQTGEGDEAEITLLLNQMINKKICDGSIRLSARPQKGETIGEKEVVNNA